MISAVLMMVALYIIYPHYQYYIDPDGTAYLTISQRYADGDMATAVNGYWSPWSCWLTALVIKAGIAAIPASVMVNTLGALCVSYIFHSFLLFFEIGKEQQRLLHVSVAIFLCYAVFWQSFDDLWECFFLLAAMRLMLGEQFSKRVSYQVLYGVLGACAYFAKSYALPFFFLNTVCCTWFVVSSDGKWLRFLGIVAVTFFCCAFPWLWALHDKYGIWTTSTAGKLNTSWYLVGHPYWKDGIDVLLPPAYKGSPNYWEDPYVANGNTPHFWSSFYLFGRQLLRIGYNMAKLIVCMFRLSFVLPLFALYAVRYFVRLLAGQEDKDAGFPRSTFIVVLSALLFPTGYFLVNFEPRYIWYVFILLIVIAALFIQVVKNERVRNAAAILLSLSIVIEPLWGLRKMYDEGKADLIIAQQLKQLNIKGSFTAVAYPAHEAQRLERISYFSGIQLYSIPKQAPEHEILKDMRRYHVNYYFDHRPYGAKNGSGIVVNRDEQGNVFPELTNGAIPGLRVYQVND